MAVNNFQIESIADAEAYLEWSQQSLYRFFEDLIKRQLDLSVISLGKLNTSVSVEEAGKIALVFSAEKKAYQKLVTIMDELKEEAIRKLKEKEGD